MSENVVNEPTVRFHGHACLSFDVDGQWFLHDPWFEGDVFNNSWSLLVKPDLSAIDFTRLKSIWISHEHPDHLHFGSLRAICERTGGGVKAYYREQKNPNVRNSLTQLGFDVVELPAHKKVSVAPALSVTLFPEGTDSALVVQAGNRVILNQNDCRLSNRSVALLRRMFPMIDAWFFQFSLAGWYANLDDPAGLARARQKHLHLIARYFRAFRPLTYVPFASFIYFSKQANAYMNDWIVTLDDVMAFLPNAPTQILWCADSLRWRDWSERNRENLERWRSVYRAPKQVKPHVEVGGQEIHRAAVAFAKRGLSYGPSICRPPELHLQIRETGRAISPVQ